MECLGSKENRASHLTMSGTIRMTLVSDLHCVHFLQPRVSIPRTQEASQRKGVNWKPFHANFETHFLSTHSGSTDQDHSWNMFNIQLFSRDTTLFKSEHEKISIWFRCFFCPRSTNTTISQTQHLPLFLPLTGTEQRLATGIETCKHAQGDNNRV